MTTYSPFDVVVVPFPYSDRLAEKRRPALVVSDSVVGARLGRLWVIMITSDRGAQIDGDSVVSDLSSAGLPAASIIRASKIATIDVTRVLRRAGRLSDPDQAAARAVLRLCAGF